MHIVYTNICSEKGMENTGIAQTSVQLTWFTVLYEDIREPECYRDCNRVDIIKLSVGCCYRENIFMAHKYPNITKYK